MKALAPLLAQTFVFSLGAVAVPSGLVATGAWVGLYLAVSAASSLAAYLGWPRWPAWTWLAALGYTLLFAALFCGANLALDALHGAHRPNADVARHLGGLELWFVLFPGIASMAVSGFARTLLSRQARA